jgi:periplasmic divalent cation tolerance protein
MTGIVSFYATFANADEARIIARKVVDERLAACANILGPCQSIYHWQDKVEEAEEVAALFKTAEPQAEALIARIAELHSYDVPAIAASPIVAAHPAYAEWIRNVAKSER